MYVFFSFYGVFFIIGLLKLVCYKVISLFVSYKVFFFYEKEVEVVWMILKEKNFLILEFDDVLFMCDLLG